ncbi:MAG: hypothetical protein R3A52_14880 [Polyangiales bacterium]
MIAAGCGGSTTTLDASAPTDIGSDIAVDRPDAPDVTLTTDTPDVGVATPDAPDAGSAPCTLAPAGAVALTLRGMGAAYRDAGAATMITETVDLYLPMGRVAGAPVVFAFLSSWPTTRLQTLTGTFDASLGASGFAFSGYRGGQVTFGLSLDGPDGAPVMEVTRNLNFSTDVPDFVSARLTLCPDGAPAPTLRFATPAAPTLPIELIPSAPIAAGVDGVTMTVAGAAVRATATYGDGVLRVEPTAPWPVNEDVTLDLSTLRDVMGRPFTTDGALITLRTTATVTDGSFDTAPPAGAVSPTRAPEGGRLPMSSERDRARTLVALGDLGPATRVSLRYAYRCTDPGDITARVVAANGVWREFTLAPPSTDNITPRGSAESVADVPGSGPLWLVVEQTQQPSQPGWGVPFGPCPFLVESVGPASM